MEFWVPASLGSFEHLRNRANGRSHSNKMKINKFKTFESFKFEIQENFNPLGKEYDVFVNWNNFEGAGLGSDEEQAL